MYVLHTVRSFTNPIVLLAFIRPMPFNVWSPTSYFLLFKVLVDLYLQAVSLYGSTHSWYQHIT